jgi:predicted aldo/keto reductase-like oxidoreductase
MTDVTSPVATGMELRRLGRTNLMVSSVGFGTCQLRLVPERQAVETLLRGFELGVNLVHTAPDYEGVDPLVARAIRESGREIYVLPQAYDVHYNTHGRVEHFERLFEDTLRTYGVDRLPLFGIACLDDREAFKENVWGPSGMVEFLLRMKSEGVIGGLFGTTHGGPDFVMRVLEADVFDALMIAYNSLGFHLLSFSPPEGRSFENMTATREQIFPAAAARDVGVIVMKALAGGLLCDSRAFPPRAPLAPPTGKVRATELLRAILTEPAVACVLPGTASPDEAEENALAGHVHAPPSPETEEAIRRRVGLLRANLCSRCGECEGSCSQGLHISWLFRAGYVNLQPSETYETWDDVEYFTLHPERASVCATCPAVTCACPYGIEIPSALQNLHAEMVGLAERNLIRAPDFMQAPPIGDDQFAAKVILLDVPARAEQDHPLAGRVYVQNAGTRGWFPDDRLFAGARVALAVYLDAGELQRVPLRHDTHSGGRAHFPFELPAHAVADGGALELVLLSEHRQFDRAAGLVLYRGELGPCAAPVTA